MSFEDLDSFLVVQPVKLPIKGKTYEFPGAIPARTGLMLQRMAAAAEKAKGDGAAADLAAEILDDDEEFNLRADVMGDGEKAMADDGLTSAHVKHVFQTLLVWHMAGREAAEKAWRDLGEAPAPNRAARRGSKDSASTTKPRASTSGTTTRPAAPRAAAAG